MKIISSDFESTKKKKKMLFVEDLFFCERSLNYVRCSHPDRSRFFAIKNYNSGKNNILRSNIIVIVFYRRYKFDFKFVWFRCGWCFVLEKQSEKKKLNIFTILPN